jgi:hypothetical protein
MGETESGGIIIIGGTGTPRAEISGSTSYPVVAGETVANQAASGPSVGLTFTSNAMVMTDFWLIPGDKWDVTEAGAVALQP